MKNWNFINMVVITFFTVVGFAIGVNIEIVVTENCQTVDEKKLSFDEVLEQQKKCTEAGFRPWVNHGGFMGFGEPKSVECKYR